MVKVLCSGDPKVFPWFLDGLIKVNYFNIYSQHIASAFVVNDGDKVLRIGVVSVDAESG